jgi:RNA polymerase sigma-70 factor (ECF subfamily)
VFHNEKEILQKIAEGDEGAFNILYQKISPIAYGVAVNLLKDSLQAEDIVQDIFVKLWSGRKTLPVVQSLENFVFILTRNAVFSHFKKVTLETKVLAAIKENTMSNDTATFHLAEEREYQKILQSAISQLPPQQQQVYMLAEEKELSYNEIALSMHLSKETVKRHLALARKFIRSYVSNRLHPCVVFPVCICLAMG